MRPVPFTLLALAMLAAHPAASEVNRESSEKLVPATGLRSLWVENSRGSIDVRPSVDGQIHLTALKVTRSSSAAERQRIADQTRVSASIEGGTYAVRVSYSASTSIRVSFWDLFNGFEMPRCDVQLSLEVPSGFAVTLRSSSGDLSTSGITGAQALESSSGDVSVRDAPGTVQVNTSSGDVTANDLGRARMTSSSGDFEIDGVRGGLELHSSSGDVTVRGARDSIAVWTTSGDLDLESAPRWIHARTESGRIQLGHASGVVQLDSQSGDIEVALSSPLAGIEIGSSSGEVEMTVDRGAGLALDVRTASGTIEAELPVRVTQASRHALAGTMGNGQTPLTVHTSSGDIHLRTGGR